MVKAGFSGGKSSLRIPQLVVNFSFALQQRIVQHPGSTSGSFYSMPWRLYGWMEKTHNDKQWGVAWGATMVCVCFVYLLCGFRRHKAEHVQFPVLCYWSVWHSNMVPSFKSNQVLIFLAPKRQTLKCCWGSQKGCLGRHLPLVDMAELPLKSGALCPGVAKRWRGIFEKTSLARGTGVLARFTLWRTFPMRRLGFTGQSDTRLQWERGV